jgi:hypothetical protein
MSVYRVYQHHMENTARAISDTKVLHVLQIFRDKYYWNALLSEADQYHYSVASKSIDPDIREFLLDAKIDHRPHVIRN